MFSGPALFIERVLKEEEEKTGWAALQTMLILYGIIFGVFSVAFCLVRLHFPHIYNVRNNVARLHCKLSENAYGRVSWIWKVMRVSEDEIFEQCGMDALCLLRIFRMGFRMSMAGIFCSTFLLPIYITADAEELVDPETGEVLEIDNWLLTTSSNVPEGSLRYIATAIAAWVISVYNM